MNATTIDRDSSLHDLALTFVTVIYAASVHSFVSDARDADGVRLVSAFVTAGLILFIFSDWTSRTRLPRLLPETLSPTRTLLKVLIEILGVYFLVTSFLSIVFLTHSDHQDNLRGRLSAASAFAVFLALTWLWDLLMLDVMKDLAWPTLFWASAKGRVMDLDAVRHKYLARFDRYWRSRQSLIAKLEETDQAQTSADKTALWPSIRLALRRSAAALFEPIIRVLVQCLANHTAWSNLVAALVIWIEEISFLGHPIIHVAGPIVHTTTEWVPIWCQLATVWLTILLVVIVLVGRLIALPIVMMTLVLVMIGLDGAFISTIAILFLTSLLFVLSTILFSWKRPWTRTAGGILLLAITATVYLSLRPLWIVALLSCQQILANIFLQLSTERGSTLEVAGGVDASTMKVVSSIPPETSSNATGPTPGDGVSNAIAISVAPVDAPSSTPPAPVDVQ